MRQYYYNNEDDHDRPSSSRQTVNLRISGV